MVRIKNGRNCRSFVTTSRTSGTLHASCGSTRNLGLHHPDHLTQYPKELAMSKIAITSPELTPPVGPFSQAIEVGGFLYFSGQVGQDPATGKVVEGGVVAETASGFRHLSGVLHG